MAAGPALREQPPLAGRHRPARGKGCTTAVPGRGLREGAGVRSRPWGGGGGFAHPQPLCPGGGGEKRGLRHPPAPESAARPSPSAPSSAPASAEPPSPSSRAPAAAAMAAAAAGGRRPSSRAGRAGGAAWRGWPAGSPAPPLRESHSRRLPAPGRGQGHPLADGEVGRGRQNLGRIPGRERVGLAGKGFNQFAALRAAARAGRRKFGSRKSFWMKTQPSLCWVVSL